MRGPGGPKSDRIPAMLSNGEHVLTAAEVRAMGGHGRVAKMRKSAMGTGGGDDDGGGHGFLGWLSDRVDNVKDALKKGYEYALKWVLSKFTNLLGRPRTTSPSRSPSAW